MLRTPGFSHGTASGPQGCVAAGLCARQDRPPLSPWPFLPRHIAHWRQVLCPAPRVFWCDRAILTSPVLPLAAGPAPVLAWAELTSC